MEKDLRSNVFFSDNERYADIINGFGCEGDTFVKGEDLQELDTKMVYGKVRRKGGRRTPPLYRDLLRKASFGVNFAIVGIENQEEAVAYTGDEDMFKLKEKHKKGGKVNMCQGLAEWLADERAEGKAEGEAVGSERMSRLIIVLTEQGRQEDLLKAAKDSRYREELLEELII